MKFCFHDWGEWSNPFATGGFGNNPVQYRCCNVCKKGQVKEVKIEGNSYIFLENLAKAFKEKHMNKNDIVQMARKAGFFTDGNNELCCGHYEGICSEELERFAHIVAAFIRTGEKANNEKLNTPEERVKESEKNEHEAQPVALMVLEDCGWEFVEGLDGDWIKKIPIGTVLYMHPTPSQLEHFAELVAEREREACATVCEQRKIITTEWQMDQH